MIQDAHGSLSFKLLLLQDALEVLHALVCVLHVCGQMTVQETDRMAKHSHASADAPFIPLQSVRERDQFVFVFRFFFPLIKF